MRQTPDYFGEVQLELVYIAKKLKEALRLEQLLTDSGVEYLVEPDRYRGGVLFQSERVGAFFYVAQTALEATRAVLDRNGFRPYEPAP